MSFPKCRKDCLGYYVNIVFAKRYSTYVTVVHTISDENLSENSVSKDTLKPTTLHNNTSFYLQLMEASFDKKKRGLRCIFLSVMTIQFCVGVSFRISGCLFGRRILVLAEKTENAFAFG